MGFKDAWDAQMERSKTAAVYATHTLSGDKYSYLPKGGFKSVKKHIGGAVAEYESKLRDFAAKANTAGQRYPL